MNKENIGQMQSTENRPPNALELKKRNGCVTVWLAILLATSSWLALSEILHLIEGEIFWDGLVFGMLYTANIVFVIKLFKWKRLGFWGILCTSIIAVVCNLLMGFGTRQSLQGLISVLLLYGILHIKYFGVSAWENLE